MTNQSSDAVNQCGNDPVEIANELREYAGNSGYSHNDYADVMRQAAGMLEAFASIKDQQAQPVEQDGNAVRNAIIDDVVDALSTAYSKASYNEHVDCVEIVQKMKSKPVQPGKLRTAPIDQQAHGAMPDKKQIPQEWHTELARTSFARSCNNEGSMYCPSCNGYSGDISLGDRPTKYDAICATCLENKYCDAAPQAPASISHGQDYLKRLIASARKSISTDPSTIKAVEEFGEGVTIAKWVDIALLCDVIESDVLQKPVQERNTVIERCAEVCDGLAKLYDREDIGFDKGYTMAAERAAKEIRELKE
jgi:hypothetical protein